MKGAVLIWLVVVLPAFAQAPICTGSMWDRVCTMPDGTQLQCHPTVPASDMSVCTATGPNGYVGTGLIPSVFGMIFQARFNGRVASTRQDLFSTINISVKQSTLLMGLSVLMRSWKVITNNPELQRQADENADKFADLSAAESKDMTKFAKSWAQPTEWGLYRMAKPLREFHDTALTDACHLRDDSERMVAPVKRIIAARRDAQPSTYSAILEQAVAIVESDREALAPECTTKQAMKLLRKQAEKDKVNPAGNQ
jgi:hypothetical protein